MHENIKKFSLDNREKIIHHESLPYFQQCIRKRNHFSVLVLTFHTHVFKNYLSRFHVTPNNCFLPTLSFIILKQKDIYWSRLNAKPMSSLWCTQNDQDQFNSVLRILQELAGEYGMRWSSAKTQRMVFKYKGCRNSTPKEIIILKQKI